VLRGSGVAASETRVVPAFSAVSLAGASDVSVEVGGEQQVVVHADDNLLAIVTTEFEGGTLVVSQSESFDSVTPARVEIGVPSLDALRLSGAGDLTVDGHDLERLAVDLTGAGTLRGSGSVDRLDVLLSGAGDVELEGLVAGEASAMLSGAGNIAVNVTRALDAKVSGVGTISYAGDPAEVKRLITGPGAIVAR
jgi:hypothetical protein